MILILLAGLMNGSYPIPLRFIKHTNKNRIWFIYSIIGLTLLPWIILLALVHLPLSIYLSISYLTLTILIIGGVIFGVGQTCFAGAIDKVGVALAFSITLSVGTAIGSLFTVFYQGEIFSIKNLAVIISVTLIIVSLVNYYFAGNAGEKNSSDNTTNKSSYKIGWLLALFAGIATGIQNISFIIALHSETALEAANSFWAWPPFLLAASIPMVIIFYSAAEKSSQSTSTINLRDLIGTLIMGICFSGSLWIYSSGINNLSPARQVIAWPILMIAIILTSQLWGLIYHEFDLTKTRTKVQLLLSVGLLIAAIIVLAIGV